MTEFWDSVYPAIEDGDREFRAKPFDWMNITLDLPIRSTPIVVRWIL